jgi:hypothetical protein
MRSFVIFTVVDSKSVTLPCLKLGSLLLNLNSFFIFDWYQYNSLAPNWLKVRAPFHTNNSGEQAETELSSLLWTYFSLST